MEQFKKDMIDLINAILIINKDMLSISSEFSKAIDHYKLPTKLTEEQKELVLKMNSLTDEFDEYGFQMKIMPDFPKVDYKKRDNYKKEMSKLRVEYKNIQKQLGIEEDK